MKNNKLDSVVFMWISFGLVALAILMLFVPLYTIEGQIYNGVTGFFGNNSTPGAWPSFVGYMLLVVGALMTGFLALPSVQVSYSGEKLILICASVLELIGIVLIMDAVVWVCLFKGQIELVTHAGYHLHAGSYITAVLTCLGIACNVRALLLDR